MSKIAVRELKPFSQFPKKREPLPEKYQQAFSDYYKKNRRGKTLATSFSSRLESWMHFKVAGCTVKRDQKILEIGAGTLNHVPYESQYSTYDIVEPCEYFYQDSVLLNKINRIYSDALTIDEANKYDKIISIATFEHVINLPQVIAKSGLLLTDGGRLCFAIPNEGTPLWVLGYTLTTGIEFRLKYGLDYSVVMQNEHVNTAREIKEVAEYFIKASNSNISDSIQNLPSINIASVPSHPWIDAKRNE